MAIPLRKVSLIASLYLAPVIFFELAFQVFMRQHVMADSYLYKLFSFVDSGNKQLESGLHRANVVTEGKQIGLFDWEQNPGVKKAKFRTDKYGTIIPSSLEEAEKSSSRFYLFCGGSTTESYLVSEGNRPPDIFTKNTGVKAVNSAKSGKDIYGCLSTIDFLLTSSSTRPQKIIIANNVNTLMTYGHKLFTDRRKSQPQEQPLNDSNVNRDLSTRSQKIKSVVRRSMPGTYWLLHNLKSSMPGGDVRDYEQGLKEGCCHGAAGFNRSASSKFEWYSSSVQQGYKDYVAVAIQKLDKLLSRYNIPKNQVVIFIEPNSFGLDGVAANRDFRQLLFSSDGKVMTALESAKATSIYDDIYRRQFQSRGYRTLSISDSRVGKEGFYDAVHLSSIGSKRIGEYYADQLDLN